MVSFLTVKLTTRHVVTRLRISGAIPPLHSFMASSLLKYRNAFTFTLVYTTYSQNCYIKAKIKLLVSLQLSPISVNLLPSLTTAKIGTERYFCQTASRKCVVTSGKKREVVQDSRRFEGTTYLRNVGKAFTAQRVTSQNTLNLNHITVEPQKSRTLVINQQELVTQRP